MTAVRMNGTGRLFVCRCFASGFACVHAHVGGMLMLMLMFVVTKVSDSSLCIMSAVRRHGRPVELERQQCKQEDGEETVHGRKSSG